MLAEAADWKGSSLREEGRMPGESTENNSRSHESEQQQGTRIVVVDPHPYSAEGLRVLVSMLTDDMEVVSTVDNARKAPEQICSHSANLLIIEPWLPETMSTIKETRELADDIKIIALTTQEDRRHAVETIRMGAHAYISKRIQHEELIRVIRIVRTGRIVLSAFAARTLVGRPERGPGALTEQDRKLLELIVEGLDNNEIARHLAVSESTLKRNTRQLLKKLNARNKTEAAVRATLQGVLGENQ